MAKPKLYMKYFVLKLDDTLDLTKLRYYVNTTNRTFIEVRDFAEKLLDCIVETHKEATH